MFIHTCLIRFFRGISRMEHCSERSLPCMVNCLWKLMRIRITCTPSANWRPTRKTTPTRYDVTVGEGRARALFPARSSLPPVINYSGGWISHLCNGSHLGVFGNQWLFGGLSWRCVDTVCIKILLVRSLFLLRHAYVLILTWHCTVLYWVFHAIFTVYRYQSWIISVMSWTENSMIALKC